MFTVLLMKYINLEYHPCDSRIKIVDYDVCQTLNSRMGTGGGNVPLILVLEDQGGVQISWNTDELSPTLRAESHGHPPLILENNEQIDRYNSRPSDTEDQ